MHSKFIFKLILKKKFIFKLSLFLLHFCSFSRVVILWNVVVSLGPTSGAICVWNLDQIQRIRGNEKRNKHKMVQAHCTTNFHSGWIVNFLCREEATTPKWEGAKGKWLNYFLCRVELSIFTVVELFFTVHFQTWDPEGKWREISWVLAYFGV